MSMDTVDIVHGLSGHCPLTQWTVDIVHGHLDKVQRVQADWTMSMVKVQSDLVKKIEVKVACLEIYIHMSQVMRLWYLSHRQPAKAQASLRIRAV